MRRFLSALLLGSLLAGCSGDNGDSGAGGGPSSFMIAVIPDTQFLSENNKRGFLNLDPRYPGLPYEPALAYYAQTEWLAANADTYRIPFVVHVGDIVQNGGEKRAEWQVANKAMATLEDAGVSYGLAPGNHDVRDKAQFDNERFHAIEGYLRNFGPARASEKNAATFLQRDPLGYSEAHVFEVLGQRFMVISMDWKPSDATLAWAQGVITAQPTLPVIITSHNILDYDQNQGSAVLTGDNGQRLWDALIDPNDQVFMTLSGHNHYAARLTRTNRNGHKVEMILADYQDEYAGGNGLLRLMELDLAAGRVDAYTFSPWALQKRTEAKYRSLFVPCPTPEVTADCDQIAPEPNTATPGAYYDNRYSFPLDFRARFAPFRGYTATVGAPTASSLWQQLHQRLLAAVAAAP